MVVQTRPCRNAAELVNPVDVRSSNGSTVLCTHRCMQAHTEEHELFALTHEGLCPFEDGCPHFEAVNA